MIHEELLELLEEDGAVSDYRNRSSPTSVE